MPRGIVVRGLSKSHGGVQAIADVGFAVAPGEVLGLLGPNGAGKTTTIEAITGLAAPDAGEIEICGIDARAHPLAAKRKTGVVLQSTGLPDRITPREAIALFARLHGVRADVAALIARFGLAEKAAAPFATLSGGQRQRLALALAFVGAPEAVLLDEPTAGLDPHMRRDIHARIQTMRRDGCAVLLATHDMEEAERLCDRVAILDHGRVVAKGPPAALIAAARTAAQVTIRTDGVPAQGWPAVLPAIGVLAGDGDTVRFTAGDVNRALVETIAFLDAAGLGIVALRVDSATLEDVILRLTTAPERG